MGAWDVGSFSNDDALDYVAEVGALADVRRVLDAVVGTDGEIEAPEACEALAAADILAGLIGRPAPDLAAEERGRLAALGAPPKSLLATARQAVGRVADRSELAELWDESEPEAWRAAVDDLLARLDPETDYVAPEMPSAPSEGGYACAICETAIPDDELFRIDLDLPGLPGARMALYVHRGCVEKTFKPPYGDGSGDAPESLIVQLRTFLDEQDDGQF